ncbi:hypothetical protein PIB30_113544 [Stylosanthes scabra]|uniref:Uncharacterized protein n=1 Tax=Stylosanthes scabra TaxID=79078 RepID=A0ABU6XYA3_9FABA|nr:hypothetical protein [Stylosanthes scabra]
MKGYKICWPFFMIQHMLKLQGRTLKPFGYGPLWSKVYEHLGVNVEGARKVVITSRSCINDTTLKQMRRQQEQQPLGADEVDEEENRIEEEERLGHMGEEEGQMGTSSPHHQPHQAQPTMFDLVQEMRSMNENLQAFQMETRGQYQSMNTRIGRVERSVQAIHNHLGINYEDQDEEED